MAWSAAALTAAEIAGFDNDKPMMVVQQADSTSDSHWTFDGNTSGTDMTDADYPASRAYDDIGSLVTMPSSDIQGTISAATKANPCVITATGHGLLDGQEIYITGVSGMTQLNYTEGGDNVYVVANKTTNTFELSGINSSAYGVWSSGGTVTTAKFFHFVFSPNITIDSLLILGHNFNSGGAINASLQIADNTTFSSNLKEIGRYVCTGTSDDRILITNLNHDDVDYYDDEGTAQRYSGVQYARLRVLDNLPDVGEIVLGYRYQLQRNPDLSWNNKNEVSRVTNFQANSGLTKRYVFSRGAAVRNISMGMSDSAEITVIDNWFNAINEGTRPFVWIDTPSSDPKPKLMYLDDAALNFPLVGPFERTLEFSMTEQPPYESRE